MFTLAKKDMSNFDLNIIFVNIWLDGYILMIHTVCSLDIYIKTASNFAYLRSIDEWRLY